ILMGELLSTYDRLMAGSGGQGQKAALQREDNYEDYIKYVSSLEPEASESYWSGYLAGIESGTLLPFITPTSERTKGLGRYREDILRIDKGLTTRLSSYAQRHRITVNTVMQGVWSYLLYRYTGNRRVIYGVTVSGR